MPTIIKNEYFDVNLQSFLTEDTFKCWLKYWEKIKQRPDIIIKKNKFVFKPTEEEKLFYKSTFLNWANSKCLKCSLLSDCLRKFILSIYNKKCNNFLYWKTFRTDSWNKKHKYNPELNKVGLSLNQIKEISKNDME